MGCFQPITIKKRKNMKRFIYVFLSLLIFCTLLMGCSDKGNDLIFYSDITGFQVHFNVVHETVYDENKAYEKTIIFKSPEELIADLTERECFLYYDTEKENPLIYYRMFGGIFYLEYLGNNNQNQNAYDYIHNTNEIFITNTETKIVEGNIFFPTFYSIFKYSLGDRIELSFEALTDFYSLIPEEAEIDEINKTITVDLYSLGKISQTKYAVIRHNGDSFEITVEEY
jgi:hypothetical protein